MARDPVTSLLQGLPVSGVIVNITLTIHHCFKQFAPINILNSYNNLTLVGTVTFYILSMKIQRHKEDKSFIKITQLVSGRDTTQTLTFWLHGPGS